MADKDKDLRHEVALFRFRVIGEVVARPPGSPGIGALLEELAAREWDIPGSNRRRVAVPTIRAWVRAYRLHGFDALHPKPRSDHGRSRRLPAAVAELLVATKQKHPSLSVPAVMRKVRASGQLPAGVRLARSTVYRLLASAGLTRCGGGEAAGQDRRRFSYEFAGELYMSDVLHGPKIAGDPGDRRRRRRSYLIAILDDATRVIPHAAFAFSESVRDFLPVLRQALVRRGIPQRFYVDNGSNYRSRHLALICASLGIHLIHARAYQPAGKGKIERFFRTVRSQFLTTLEDPGSLGLAALNQRWGAWVEHEYHRTPHRGLGGETPLQRWAQKGAGMRPAGPEEGLGRLFLFRHERRVARDRTVSLHGVLYEVDAALVGRKVVLLQDPAASRGEPLDVLFEGADAGQATLLDLHANARARRDWQKTGEQDEEVAEAEEKAEPIALRELDPED